MALKNQNNQKNHISKQVISVFENRAEFLELLKVNPGLIVVKLGATWCGPCKRIAHIVEAFFVSSPDSVICADIDVDESFDLYSFLKHKQMVNGIPAILCYKRGNVGFAPDDMVTGADPNALDAFFKRCGVHLITALKNFPNPLPSRMDSRIN
jgi:thioredoxin 1